MIARLSVIRRSRKWHAPARTRALSKANVHPSSPCSSIVSRAIRAALPSSMAAMLARTTDGPSTRAGGARNPARPGPGEYGQGRESGKGRLRLLRAAGRDAELRVRGR
ncbi:hypothetical protein [Ornithinimicrobium kibberense]|uniref:hypothetical protein n=1 Tax=Ornithinimicrobium kibberense TaxID=282060 RepID=UPI0036173C2A